MAEASVPSNERFGGFFEPDGANPADRARWTYPPSLGPTYAATVRRAAARYRRRRLTFGEYTIFLLMTLLFLVLAYSLANMLHALYSEYILDGLPVTFVHYALMCTFLLIVFFALDRYFFEFSILPY